MLAIILVDYFLVRATELNVTDLYRRKGEYAYSNGINRKAVWALLIGVLPNVPGFLAQVGFIREDIMPRLVSLYDYAWFIGLGIAGMSYYLLMRRSNE